MPKRLRLGIVGCGDIAGPMAAFAHLNRRIRLVACCDRTLAIAGRFAARFRIPRAYDDYRAVLENESLDAVYLAVPHHLHYEMSCDAIRAGLHVLVEKPIARTLEEGVRVVHLAQERGVKVGVNYQYRYDTGCYALARAVQVGDLGAIYYARINVPWHREQAYFDLAAWHARLAHAGGGTLITQGSHFIDLLLWAIPAPPRAAVGWTAQSKFRQVEVEDLAQGIVELESGALVQICSAMVAHREQAVTIEVYGEDGTATYTDRPWPRVRFRGARVEKRRPPHRGVHALQRSLEGFRAWVMEGKPYLIPAGEGLPALAVVEAIYRSAQTGSRENVDLSPISNLQSRCGDEQEKDRRHRPDSGARRRRDRDRCGDGRPPPVARSSHG